jgi:hypothetical protein
MNNYTVSIKSLVLLIALAAILVLLTAITVSATVYSPWTREAVETGTSGDRECGKVGDADNDGDNEIISANTGYIDMHEWSGAAWSRTIIDDTLGTVVVYDVAIADVDNTGRNKIAVALSNNTIFLYNWTGTAWECSVVSNQVDDGVAAGADMDVLDLSVGDADNTGCNKIVAGTEGGEVAMFNWTAGSWSRTEICDRTPKRVPNVEVSDCDNDGSIEVFVCEDKGGYVYHYNGAWALESTVGTISEVALNADVGDADNTGCNKILVSTNSNDIYMYNWTGSWTETTVTSGSGTEIYDMKIGDVYNDGTNHIVSGDSADDVKIYTWTTSWDSFTVDDAAGGAVLEVTSGDADNDGLEEIVIGMGGTSDDIYMYYIPFNISDVNASGPYDVGGTISVTWNLTGSAPAPEDYLLVEYYDPVATPPASLAVHTLVSTTTTSDTYVNIPAAQAGHTLSVYVYTAATPGAYHSSAITQGTPWPESAVVHAAPEFSIIVIPLISAIIIYMVMRRRKLGGNHG